MSWWAQDKNIKSRTSFLSSSCLIVVWLYEVRLLRPKGSFGSRLVGELTASRQLRSPAPASFSSFASPFSSTFKLLPLFSKLFGKISRDLIWCHTCANWMEEGWLSASRQLRPPRRRRWSGRQDPAGFPLPTPLLTHWHTGHTTRHNDSSKSEMDSGETERYSKHSERNTVESRARRSSDTPVKAPLRWMRIVLRVRAWLRKTQHFLCKHTCWWV